MGFNIKHLNKYWRWLKKHRAEYKDNCKISKKYARLCSDLDIALLLRKPDAEMDQIAMRKHEWVLNYIKQKCPDTIERYRNMPAPKNLNDPNKDIKVWSMWVGYFMAGNKEFPLFPFVRDCLYEYWKNCDKVVDYLMMD